MLAPWTPEFWALCLTRVYGAGFQSQGCCWVAPVPQTGDLLCQHFPHFPQEYTTGSWIFNLCTLKYLRGPFKGGPSPLLSSYPPPNRAAWILLMLLHSSSWWMFKPRIPQFEEIWKTLCWVIFKVFFFFFLSFPFKLNSKCFMSE